MTWSSVIGIMGQSARQAFDPVLRWLRPTPRPEGEPELTPERVAQTLARRKFWLGFPPDIEARFERDTGAARSRFLVRTGMIAMVLTNCFALLDRATIPDAFKLSLILRFAICTPLGILVTLLVALNVRPSIREATGVFMALLSTAVIMILTFETKALAQVHLPYGVLLVVMFACSVQVLRFPYLLVTCGGVLATTFVCLSQFDGPLGEQMMLIPGIVLATTILGSVAGYSNERASRRAYLNGLLQQLYANKLEAMSSSDPLTGVGNRRALDRRLDHIARRSPQTPQMAAIVIDIDYFKQFNDSFGHDAGDQCLRRVADILASEARTSDGIFRLGGEEFLVLLSGADIPTARGVAERMRLAVLKAAIPHNAPVPNSVVTASFGVASGLIDATADLTHLIKAADAALYGSKRAGRNQVSVADPTLVALFAAAQARAA